MNEGRLELEYSNPKNPVIWSIDMMLGWGPGGPIVS